MNVYLVRHGDPDYENDSLTELGRREAEKLGEYLKYIPFTHLYSSPMGRARETCEPVARACAIEPVVLPWLHELNGDDGEFWVWCISVKDLAARPDLARHIESVMQEQKEMLMAEWKSLLAGHGYACEDGVYRVRDNGAPVIGIFAHGGLILTLLSGLLGWPLPLVYAYLDYKPSAITHLKIVGDKESAVMRVVSVNSRPHLESTANLDIGGDVGGRYLV